MSKTRESGRKARLVRMSRELDARLTEAATSARISDNEFMVRAIERALAVHDAQVRNAQDIQAREQQLDKGQERIVALLAAMHQRRGVTRAKLEAEAHRS
jgi:HicB family